MNPTTNPTTPPEPQAGATPDIGTQCPICHAGPLRFSYDSYGTHAYCDSGCHGEILLPCYIEEAKALIRKQSAALATSRAETEGLRGIYTDARKFGETLQAWFPELNCAASFPFERALFIARKYKKLQTDFDTLTATLAQRDAEVAAIRSFLKVPEYGDPLLALKTREELAMQAVSARDTAIARVRELEAAIAERVAAKEEYDSNSGVTCLRCGEADKQLKRVLAAARADGTGEERAGV